MKLNEKEVDKLFRDCLFDDDEIIDGLPRTCFTSVENINENNKFTICFNTNKLNKNKKLIIELIDMLPEIDNGKYMEALYYDKNYYKWCNSIEILEQLLTMGIACKLINYTTIKTSKENLIIIKRTKENDNKEVKGANPFEIKKNQILSYTDEEKELIENNRIKISTELNMYNRIINTGLGFFGIRAVINEEVENQLDFFDQNNNLLFKRKFKATDGITGWEGFFNQRLKCEFKDTNSNEITYLVDGNRHIFLLYTKEYGYRIEITYDNINKEYTRIEITTEDQKDDYIIKQFYIGKTDIKVELNNQFGPFGNYEDGILRRIFYSSNEFLYITEDEWFEKGHFLHIDKFEVRLDENVLTRSLTSLELNRLMNNVLAHPRNKELLEFTLIELDKKLPGIKEFVINKFFLYSQIISLQYHENLFTTKLIEETIHEKCNLKIDKELILKKN